MEEKEFNKDLVEEKINNEDLDNDEETVIDINQEENDDELTKLKEENAKLKNDFALAYADTENLKKRLNQEAEQIKKYRIQSFALEILPVIDNLERALKQGVNEESKSFYDGIKMIYEQLLRALNNEGVKEIECLDKKFDSKFMQAISQEKIDGKESEIVIDVLQKGYILKDRILRPAMVRISE